MNLVLWVVFGMLLGIIANWVNPKKGLTELASSIILGAMGALLGGILANILLQVSIVGFNLTAFIVAMLGATALLIINNSLQKT